MGGLPAPSNHRVPVLHDVGGLAVHFMAFDNTQNKINMQVLPEQKSIFYPFEDVKQYLRLDNSRTSTSSPTAVLYGIHNYEPGGGGTLIPPSPSPGAGAGALLPSYFTNTGKADTTKIGKSGLSKLIKNLEDALDYDDVHVYSALERSLSMRGSTHTYDAVADFSPVPREEQPQASEGVFAPPSVNAHTRFLDSRPIPEPSMLSRRLVSTEISTNSGKISGKITKSAQTKFSVSAKISSKTPEQISYTSATSSNTYTPPHTNTAEHDESSSVVARPLLSGTSGGTASRLRVLVFAIALFGICSLVSCMQNTGGSGEPRGPKPWGPEMEERYPFRHWNRDVLYWSIASTHSNTRKAACVLMSLRGAAEEFARMYPADAITGGGIINGINTDPLTYLMHTLSERFSQLGEETRLAAMTELMHFRRNQNERIDALIIRFDTLRQRANAQGQLTMSIQGLVWLLLRACAVDDTQLMQLLMLTNELFPATQQEYDRLITLLKRMGHIIENSPNNVAQLLRGQQFPRTTNAYLTDMSGGPNPVEAATWSEQFPRVPAGALEPTFAAYSVPPPPAPYPQQRPPTGTYAQQYHTHDPNEWSDNGTDTDTISSVGDLPDETIFHDLDPTDNNNPNGRATHLFWVYQKAKSN